MTRLDASRQEPCSRSGTARLSIVHGSGVVLGVLLGLGACSLVPGCAGKAPRGQPRAVSEQVRPSGLLSRPRLVSSAAEKYPDPVKGQLDYFDELERRELVSHDDTIHAVLLVVAHSSAPTFVQRVALAKGHGWLDHGFDRPPREAVSVGEASMLVYRALSGHNIAAPASQAEALAELKALGIFPQLSRPGEGLTGPQLLAVMSLTGDAMRGRPMVVAPAEETLPPVFADVTPVAASVPPHVQPPQAPVAPPVPVASVETKPAAAVAGPSARPEPLPDLSVQKPPATPASVQPPVVPPVVVPVTPAAVPPQAPAVAPSVPPSQPVWVGGKPLEKKKKKP